MTCLPGQVWTRDRLHIHPSLQLKIYPAAGAQQQEKVFLEQLIVRKTDPPAVQMRTCNRINSINKIRIE